jgi:hypothetical protein
MTKLILTAAIVAGSPCLQSRSPRLPRLKRLSRAGPSLRTRRRPRPFNTPVLCHALDMEKAHEAMAAAMADLNPEQKKRSFNSRCRPSKTNSASTLTIPATTATRTTKTTLSEIKKAAVPAGIAVLA